ncbi:MAG: hypothetical protein JXA90_00090 [Planctomycetes bacterium]|nr:hypothetical protein [Planctomycetota bacterium]
MEKRSEILGLLNRFYEKVAGRAPVEAEMIEPEEIPEPYHHLLVHEGDMTSRLIEHHGEPITLRILQKSLSRSRLSRQLVLEGERSRRPLEYGAIRIHLEDLPHEVREKVIEGREPLGSILGAHGVECSSRPAAFIRVFANDPIRRAFQLPGARWLYGRCNVLIGASGDPIAEVVEILPPAASEETDNP